MSRRVLISKDRAEVSSDETSGAPFDQPHRVARLRGLVPALKAIGVAVLLGVLVLIGTAVAADRFDEPVDVFTRDVQDQFGVAWYIGAVSTINVIAWAAAGAMSLLVAWFLRGERLRLGLFGTLATVLTFDDALLLHEAVGPENGVPQELFLGAYAIAAIALLVLFLRPPRTAVTVAFFLGAALLGISVLADELLRNMLLEDGAKLLGKFVWVTVPVLTLRTRAPRDWRDLPAAPTAHPGPLPD